MTGAFITSSGEEHRGFHQSPNVLRDVYAKKIGMDGYGFLQYLLSWANSGTPLSQRRMMTDLKASQDKLERVQQLVLKHCGHFVSLIPGSRTQSNRWHLDMRLVWQENTVHLAKGFLAEVGVGGVPEITTPPKKAPKGVPETATEVYRKSLQGVPEITTFKDISNTPLKKGGEYNLENNARAEAFQEPQPPPVAQTSPAQFTTTNDAALQNSKDEGEVEFKPEVLPLPQVPSPPVAVLELPAPDGVTAGAVVEDLSLTDEEVELIFGTGNTDETKALEQVAAGGAAAETGQESPSEDENEPHDPEVTRAVLVPALGGNAKLNGFMEEVPPGLRGKSRRAWITEIRPARAIELVNQGRIEANAANPWTFIIRLLDIEIGSSIGRSGSAKSVVGGVIMNASSQAPATPLAPVDRSEDQGKFATGAQWRSKDTGEVFTVTGDTLIAVGKRQELRYVLSDQVKVAAIDLIRKYEFVPAGASA